MQLDFCSTLQAIKSDSEFTRPFRSALERFQRHLARVKIIVSDVNGPRGGNDKECRCVLYLPKSAPVVILDRDASLRALSVRVANRAAHVVSQRISKRAQRRHAGHTPLVAGNWLYSKP